MKPSFYLEAFSVLDNQPEITGTYYAFDKDGLSGDRFYDAEKKEWSSNVELWVSPKHISESEILERSGFKSEFGHLEDVIVSQNGRDTYGWIDEVHFPDVNTPVYDIYLVTSWKDEPFLSEPATFLLTGVSGDSQETTIRKSDRKIP